MDVIFPRSVGIVATNRVFSRFISCISSPEHLIPSHKQTSSLNPASMRRDLAENSSQKQQIHFIRIATLALEAKKC